MFKLNAQLQMDTFEVGDFPLCKLLLMNDSQYPWFILVPRCKEGISELYELTDTKQLQLLKEVNELSRLLSKAFNADKINVAALGNVVKQLHVHVIVRYQSDVSWPAPVWGKFSAKPYNDNEVEVLLDRLKNRMPSDFSFIVGEAL